MPRRLPPLAALRAFEATARLGSVTRAAEELGRTHGAASRQLRLLQEHAGLPLFAKAGTGLQLNAAGKALQKTAVDALDRLEQGWQRLREEAGGPVLHLACSATFAMRCLVPRLPGFYRDHPDIQLRLSMTSANEIRHQGADLVIAWDRHAFPAQDRGNAIRSADTTFGPVCRPDHPARATSRSLRSPTAIVHEYTSRAWDLWQQASGRRLAAARQLRFPHTHLCIEAALGGLGVALVERRLVQDDLAAGRLVAPCGFTAFPDGLAAVPASGHAASPPAAAFLHWIKGALADAPTPSPTATGRRKGQAMRAG